MDRDAVRRWQAGHQAAARRSLAQLAVDGPLSPEASFEAAMELCALSPVLEHDPVREREVAEARRLWSKLKAPWAAKRAAAK